LAETGTTSSGVKVDVGGIGVRVGFFVAVGMGVFVDVALGKIVFVAVGTSVAAPQLERKNASTIKKETIFFI